MVRRFAQLMIVIGLVMGGWVAYELWGTDLVNAHVQQQISGQLRQSWTQPAPAVASPPAVGTPFAFVRIPRLGADYSRAIVEGTDQPQLAEGPGHYIGTAMPGQSGDFAIAGHRVGTGSPFLDLDKLRPGDPVDIETGTSVYVYTVTGTEIVKPTDVWVIAPVPDGPLDGPANGAYLTMTTCNPKYSAKQRLIVHAVLTRSTTKPAV